MAKHLGVPASILEAPPSADLWDGQEDEKELGKFLLLGSFNVIKGMGTKQSTKYKLEENQYYYSADPI